MHPGDVGPSKATCPCLVIHLIDVKIECIGASASNGGCFCNNSLFSFLPLAEMGVGSCGGGARGSQSQMLMKHYQELVFRNGSSWGQCSLEIKIRPDFFSLKRCNWKQT